MVILKFVFLFLAIFSLVLLVEQLYLITITIRNKGRVNMNGWSQILLIALLAAATAITIVIW